MYDTLDIKNAHDMRSYLVKGMDFFQFPEINSLVPKCHERSSTEYYTLTRCMELVFVLESSKEMTIHPGTYRNCANISIRSGNLVPSISKDLAVAFKLSSNR
jgi:hypothetical protein